MYLPGMIAGSITTNGNLSREQHTRTTSTYGRRITAEKRLGNNGNSRGGRGRAVLAAVDIKLENEESSILRPILVLSNGSFLKAQHHRNGRLKML
jgi:hypothetical protein